MFLLDLLRVCACFFFVFLVLFLSKTALHRTTLKWNALHRTALSQTALLRTAQRSHLRVPAFKTPPKFHEKTPKRGKKENCGGRGKKSEMLGGLAEGGPGRGRSLRRAVLGEGGPRQRGRGEGGPEEGGRAEGGPAERGLGEGGWSGGEGRRSVMGDRGAGRPQAAEASIGIRPHLIISAHKKTGDRKTPLHQIPSRGSEKTRSVTEKNQEECRKNPWDGGQKNPSWESI